MPKEPLLGIDDVGGVDASSLLPEEEPKSHTVRRDSYQMTLELFRQYGPDEGPDEVPDNGFHDFLTAFMRTGVVKETILNKLASVMLKAGDRIGLRKLQLAFPSWQIQLQVLQSLSREEIETAIEPSTDEA